MENVLNETTQRIIREALVAQGVSDFWAGELVNTRQHRILELARAGNHKHAIAEALIADVPDEYLEPRTAASAGEGLFGASAADAHVNYII